MTETPAAWSLAAQLCSNPQIADCAVLARPVDGVLHQVAFVVPRCKLEPDMRWARADEHEADSDAPVLVMAVDRLPLQDDGSVDEQALLALPLPVHSALLSTERALLGQPGVEHAAVLLLPRTEHEPRLHIDTLPQAPLRRPAAQLECVSTEQPQDPTSRPPALRHGAAIIAQDGAANTLPESLLRAALEPGAGGLSFLENDGSVTALSLAELRDEALQITAGLANAGLVAGDFAILLLARPREVLSAFWGCLLGGFVPVVVPPAPPTSAGNELEKLRAVYELLGRPALITVHKACASLLEQPAFRPPHARVLALEQLQGQTAVAVTHRARPDDVAFLSLSSGSTGLPKCIQLTHRNILARARAASSACLQTREDVVLNWLPFDHIGSISDWHLRCVELGCHMVYCEKERVLGEPLEWLRMIERHRVTHSWAPNFAYALINSALERAGSESWDLSHLKFLLTAGEAVSSATLQQLLKNLERHGLPVTAARSAFGMAELGSGITYSRPTRELPLKTLTVDRTSLRTRLCEVDLQHARALTFSALGPVIDGMSMRIVDADLTVLPERTIGRLQVRGEALMPGYLANPEANRAFTQDGWFDTGDDGFLEQGELYLTGRSKDCIIVNGANYFPIELEKVVEELPSVSVSFTAAYTVRVDGYEQVALFFVPTDAGTRALPATLREIGQRVAARVGIKLDYLIPLASADVPKTAIGKIQRKQLAARFEAGEFASASQGADLALGNDRTVPDWFAKLTWCRCALRAERRSEPQHLVLLADDAGLGEALASQLGSACTLLHDEQPALGTRLSQLARTATGPLHVVDLRGFGLSPGAWQLEGMAAQLHKASSELSTLLSAIAEQTPGTLQNLTVVASHAQRVSRSDLLCPVRSMLPALLPAAALQTPALRVRHVDLESGQAASENARLLRLELSHDSSEAEVCYRGTQRLAQRLSAARPECGPRSALHSDALYVITGGLGGLGVELAKFLLTRFGAHVLLLGRSTLDPARAERLAGLQRMGEVAYAAVDVTSATQLKAAVERAERRWKRSLAGVFHLAGAFQQVSTLAEHEASLAQVLEAKVLGALALHELLEQRPSALMLHYSSAASVLPHASSAAYAAANRFLDNLAHHQRDQRGAASFALGFSAFRELGMNAAGVSDSLLQERGLYALDSAAGLTSLLTVLSSAASNTLIGVRHDSPALRHRFLGPTAPLNELRGFYTAPERAAALPSPFAHGVHALQLQQLTSMPLDEKGALDRVELQRLLGTGSELRVAPENALEQQLLALWKSVLKVQTLGVTCDFFAQGGHSLLAAELVHRINQCFGNNFPLSLMFEAKTVREQARLIDSGKHGKGVSIVTLQPLGDETPLFCLCGITIYQHLAAALAPEIPVYGVLLPVEGELLEDPSIKLSVVSMARQYVTAIREKQPEGPYRLLGLSFGAAIAYEVAQQLRRLGAEVSLLAMLDFVHPSGRTRSLRKLATQKFSALRRDKARLLQKTLSLVARTLPGKVSDQSNLGETRAAARQSAYAEAWTEYEPSLRHYAGKVLVVRASDQSMWDGFDVKPDLGWSRFVDELVQHDVPGDHLSILRPPNVQQLAAQLRAELLAARASHIQPIGSAAVELSPNDLGTLRERIDALDRSLIELLSERMAVVSQLADTKHEQGLPVRDLERERALLETRAAWAKQHWLPDTLVRPLFQVIMRASREEQNKRHAALSERPDSKIIALIGAHGGMGKRMCALFESLGHQVLEVDQTTALTAEQAAARADVTVIAVPIALTEQVIRQVGPHVPAHGLLMDITSLKQRPLQTMLECTGASVVGTHPMFGPLVSSFEGQRLVLCKGRGEAWARWVERTFSAAGLQVAQADAEEHDRAMAEVQVLSHFQTQVMGLTLAQLGTPLEQSLRFSTPPYLMELYMAARHFSQDSALYGSIAMDNPRTEQITQAFVAATSTLRDILQTRDKQAHAAVFTQVRSFLGSFAPTAVERSKQLVDGLTSS